MNKTFAGKVVRLFELPHGDIEWKKKNLLYFFPFGKADDTTSPALSRIRGGLLQLHP
jgi:hypothetical protein